jgi:tetratricopeptide (TPR) repeat protein
MTKWISYLIIGGLFAWSWVAYVKKGSELNALSEKITALQEAGDVDEQVAALQTNLDSLEGEKLFNGILLTFLSAGVVGILFAVFVLPFFAQRLTHSVYDSGEMVERDVMHAARSFLAQGEYESAIAAFQEAAVADPLNRLPWMEIAKIQKVSLGDSASAIGTIRYALESQQWEADDAAFFLFRLADLYDETQADRASALAILHQVIDQFSGTRHAANAHYKIQEWSMAGAESAANAEEEEYLARVRQESAAGSTQSGV